MNQTSLRAKGVEPLSCEPAILENWKLCFNIPDFFNIEGGTGNIIENSGREVHGILYACRDEHLRILDELEALGVAYQRIRLPVLTYSGRSTAAYVYTGISDRLADGHQPSRRYLNIIIRGAEEMQLRDEYIDYLKTIEVRPDPITRPFHFPDKPNVIFTADKLNKLRDHTALAGAVFSMSGARPEHSYLREFFTGKDMTLFFLRRMDSSRGEESIGDIHKGRISNEQKRYLTNYLHEFYREYRYVGRMDYTLDLSRTTKTVHKTVRDRVRRAPARMVLENAERINGYLGHENLGFLSETHGFMPKSAPRLSLPREFSVWDDVASDLTGSYRDLALRRTLDHMPVLSADENRLADTHVLRAATLMAMLSHAYFYVETRPPKSLPPSLKIPWAQLRKRLGRTQEVLTYIDLIVYNWRTKNPEADDPWQIKNLELLVPTVNNPEENTFYLTQTEILARATPIIGAIARAQEAVLHDEPDVLAEELRTIIFCFERIVHESLFNINPNPSSDQFVNPVVWSKTVAPFAVPFKTGIQGPSGTSSPIFNLMDIFFGRRKFETALGVEIAALRAHYPPFWRDFLEAAGKISIPEYVKNKSDATLNGLLKDAVEIYAGDSGFLGRHRMKVYGYLEIAFKVGRSVTIGGFSGLFKDRTWDEVDSELEYSRLERLETFPKGCHLAKIKSVGQTHKSGPEGVKHVVLDVSGTGVRYRPGDRCGILPENSAKIVRQTLDALEATGSERILLTDEWIDAAGLRQGFKGASSLKLYDFLKFARIRPVEPRVAEALHAASQNETLKEAIIDQTTERWELWDLILLLKKGGFDPKKLWNTEFLDAEYISRVVPPERFRWYSISSSGEGKDTASEIHLTVGKLSYKSDGTSGESGQRRYGTASNFLANAKAKKRTISFIINRSPRFHLPHDHSVPIIMIAGGTGFAPFRGFIAERLSHPNPGRCWLLVALSSRNFFYYNDELISAVATNRLKLDVVFSRDPATVRFQRMSESNGKFLYEHAKTGYIQDLLKRQDVASDIYKMLQRPENGGEGAHLYVCGRTRFARSVTQAIRDVFESQLDKSAEHVTAEISQIAAEGRYVQEIFTHARAWNVQRNTYNVSDIVQRNNEQKGYWLVIDNVVYDLTEFINIHPGGVHILKNYAGLDATHGYLRTHQGHSEIDAVRDIYEKGIVRGLKFNNVRKQVIRSSGEETTVALSALYRRWCSQTYAVVEMENAFDTDSSLQNFSTVRGDHANDFTLYKLQRAVETHERFCHNYLTELAGRSMHVLWELTHGMCDIPGHQSWMAKALDAIHENPSAKYPASISLALSAEADRLKNSGRSMQDYAKRKVAAACEALLSEDRSVLLEIKERLRCGLISFETHESKVLDQGADELVSQLRQIPSIIENYYSRLHELTDRFRLDEHFDARVVPIDKYKGYESCMIVSNRYWSMEEIASEKVVVLRRSAVPVDSIGELKEANDSVIANMKPGYLKYGIVVDMRQASQRNDPEFENAMLKLRNASATKFARVAVLLESSAGVLQVNRLGRNEGADTFATLSEPAAVKFAKGAA